MSRQHKSSTTPFRINTLSVAISVALSSVAGQTLAQQASGEPEIEEVVVTGSRLDRAQGDFVAPVQSMSAEEIQRSGQVDLEGFLSETPALVGSSGGFESVQGGGAQTGVNSLNLRNLGTNRTLVLVNGRRHVSSMATGESIVDTNIIPNALIERVDVLTGGASAVYGADAVSGAVNFVLRDNFEGFEAQAQGGISSRGDSQEYFSALTWGTNFSDQRGNITASYEFHNQRPLALFDRPYGIEEAQTLVNNPAEFLQEDNPNVPDQVLAKDSRYIYTAPDGRYDIQGFDTNLGREVAFGDRPVNAQGQPFDTGTRTSGFAALGGDGTHRRYYWDHFRPETTVHSFNMLGHYDISRTATAFTEVKYARTEASVGQIPSWSSSLELSLDNPFIPDGFDDPLSTIEDPSITMARDDLEIIPRDDNTRDTFRTVVGLRGDLTGWLNYEVSANYGETEQEARLLNVRREDRYFAAMDAVTDPQTGEPTCRSNLDPSAVPPIDSTVSSYNPDVWGDPVNMTFDPGANSDCVPFNPFIDGTSGFYAQGEGRADGPNAEAINFITANGSPLVDRGEVTQTIINGYLSGDSSGLGLNLPAGPVDFVLGGEYREEETSNDVDALRNNPNGLAFSGDDFAGVQQDSTASFDVTELFTEVSVPVFEDLGPFMQALRLDGAYRFSDYSTIGQTNAFSVGANWRLNDSVVLRGSFASSIRSPNINELFEPENESAFLPDDPCAANVIDRQSANTQANCREELSALGLNPEEYLAENATLQPGIVSGNPELGEESADTTTLGVVVTPSALPGFQASLDAWEIEMSELIIRPSDDDIVSQCYDAPSRDNEFCDLFERAPLDADTPGIIVNLEQRPVNVSSLATSGIDFSFSYDRTLAPELGTLSLNLSGTYLNELLIQPTVDPELQDQTGLTGTLLGEQAPDLLMNFDAFWERGPLSINYGIHFQSELELFRDEELAREPDLSAYTHTDRLIRHDIRADYDLTQGVTVYLGINNIGDRHPDPTFRNIPVGPAGRFGYAGVTANFEDLGSLF